MDKMKINDRISRLAELAAGWETHEAVDPLERDLALEILRGLYADIKFAKPEPDGCAITEPEVLPEPAACDMPVQPVESENEIAWKDILGTEPVARVAPEPERIAEPEHAAKQEPQAVAEPELQSIAEPLPAPEHAPEAEDIPVRRRKVDPGVIRSLYGEPERRQQIIQEPEQEFAPIPEKPAAPVKEESTMESAKEPELQKEEPVIKAAPATDMKSTTLPAEAPQTPRSPILGDMNAGRQTLGETLRNGEKDMASKIAAAERRDLKQSIGINDKFLMIRDMFDGDANAFGDVIAYLDTFTDLDEAIIYIHDTYDWSADSDGVKLLVELLERKLG